MRSLGTLSILAPTHFPPSKQLPPKTSALPTSQPMPARGGRAPLHKQRSYGSRLVSSMRRRSQAGMNSLHRLKRQSQSMRWRTRADRLNRRVSDNKGKFFERALAVVQKFSVRWPNAALRVPRARGWAKWMDGWMDGHTHEECNVLPAQCHTCVAISPHSNRFDSTPPPTVAATAPGRGGRPRIRERVPQRL